MLKPIGEPDSSLIMGDFNTPNVTWNYANTDKNGRRLLGENGEK